MRHYCQGKWIEGTRKKCDEPEHNVKLQQTADDYDAAHLLRGRPDGG